MEKYIFTDLACEISGEKGAKRERLSERIEKILFYDSVGKTQKEYVTFFAPKLWLLDDDEFNILKESIAGELRRFLNKHFDGKSIMRILAVGLGNPRLTTDSLGAQTVERLRVTPTDVRERGGLMAITPDVSGNTGIETFDSVGAYVDRVRPNALIVIDSLRARGYERLASTVQLSDGGIVPGGGVGKGRGRLCEATLGIPIISIGVPTVVSASTLVCDVISRCGGHTDNESVSSALDGGLELFVTPKEADILIKCSALLLAEAINLAM